MSRTVLLACFATVCVVAIDMSVCIGTDESFFRMDPLPDCNDVNFAGTFMQQSYTACENWNCLHTGIDAFNSHCDVYSANVSEGTEGLPCAVVVFQAYTQGLQCVLIAKRNDDETVAFFAGHVKPKPGIYPNMPLSCSQEVAEVPQGSTHLHATLFKDFPWTLVWDSGYQVRPDFNPDALYPYAVNPATNAFEGADWLEDDIKPHFAEPGTVAVWYVVDGGSYVFAVPAGDRAATTQSWCNNGIYKMVLSVAGAPVDSICFEKLADREGNYPPDDDDFYLSEVTEPGCNGDDSLVHYLTWTTPQVSHFYYSIKICDAAGNCIETDPVQPTVDPPRIPLICDSDRYQVRVRWNAPAHLAMDHFALYRSDVESDIGSLVNSEPIPTVDEEGFRITEYEYIDILRGESDSATLFYTLEGTNEDGRKWQLGRASLDNRPRSVALELYPNPSTETVTLGFMNQARENIGVSVFDVSGRLVKEIANAVLPRGWVTYRWDGRDDDGMSVSPGIYFAVVSRRGHTEVAKIALVR